MSKRKRAKKVAVYGVIEGKKTENDFFQFLKESYADNERINVKIAPIHGGNPDRLIQMAKKNLHCGFDKIFIWIDEDVEISDESRKILYECWRVDKKDFFPCSLGELQSVCNSGNRNPTLIVSQPVCVEALILRTLGYSQYCKAYDPSKRAAQIRQLKDTLSGIIGKKIHIEFYRENLTKQLLDEKRLEIDELHLLISMIEG